jgi:hypothetical protein
LIADESRSKVAKTGNGVAYSLEIPPALAIIASWGPQKLRSTN